MALKEVSKAEFFQVIGQLDVNPYPQGKWDDLGGYKNLWKLRDGKLVDISEPKSYGCDKNFFIVQGGKGEKTIRR